jgi:erythromycin esterase-like protein
LAEWLRGHNERHIKKDKVGFYGLDVYSLWESFDEVLKYLENKDLTKKGRLRCF